MHKKLMVLVAFYLALPCIASATPTNYTDECTVEGRVNDGQVVWQQSCQRHYGLYGPDNQVEAFKPDQGGCRHDGRLYPVGAEYLLNRAEIEAFQAEGGYVYDGEAIYATCSLIVDPAQSDFPAVGQRHYVWVARTSF